MRMPRYLLAATALLAAAISACDKSPTGPTLLPGLGGSTPPPVSISRLEIVGPDTVAPGAQAQYTTVAHRSDGTTEDVTTRAGWSSFRPTVLTIAGGLATGVAVGDSMLQARYLSLATTREIIVLPPGTFRVAGVITEGDSPSTPVVGARVDVLGGPAVPSATTFGDGRYRLYGAAGPVRIRAEKAGYQTAFQDAAISSHQTLNLVLPLVAPRLHVSGNYTLTVTVADECRPELPAETWTRRYAATVHQQGPLLRVDLSGATFAMSGGRGAGFAGRVEPSRVLFNLTPLDSYYFFYYGLYGDLVEEIGPSTYFLAGGSAALNGDGNRLEGPLSGALWVTDRDPRRFFNPSHQCQSDRHMLRLTR